jgi:hypothetical protein
MTRSILLSALAMSAACSEYNLPGSGLPPVEANPPEIATPVRTDSITQVTLPSVDVLFVIDNSCSMQDDQQSLRDNFPLFMEYFLGSGLDYHIGVVSTDMDANNQKGKLQDGGTPYLWIDAATPNPDQVFGDMALLGTMGSGIEAGIGAAYSAIEIHSTPGGFNDGFYREDARLDVVIISDEEDQTATSVITKAEFIQYLLDLKSDPSLVGFSSIVNIQPCCSIADGGSPGEKYLDVTNAVGGITWDIKDGAWDQLLQLLGIQAAGLKREFFLSELPVPGSIEVVVTDVDGTEYEFQEEVDWTYNATRNSVAFLEYLPPPLADVVVTYEALAAAESN